MQDERRKEYFSLNDLRLELVAANANLTNIIDMFRTHLEDDKRTVQRVDNLSDRVTVLSVKMAIIGGCIVIVSGSLITAIIKVFA